jgi:hypothetical protein
MQHSPSRTPQAQGFQAPLLLTFVSLAFALGSADRSCPRYVPRLTSEGGRLVAVFHDGTLAPVRRSQGGSCDREAPESVGMICCVRLIEGARGCG